MRWIEKFLFAGVLLIGALLLAGCQPSSPDAGDDSVTSAGDSSDTGPSSDEQDVLALVEDGVPARVVVAFNASEALNTVAENIAKMLGNVSDTAVRVTKDSEDYDADAVEILIGDTAYPESAQAAQTLAYGDWCVTAVGNKIVVYAFSEAYYTSAGTHLISLIYAQREESRVVIDGDYHQTGTSNALINAVPRLGDLVPSAVYTTGVDIPSSGAVFPNAGADDFEAYRTSVAAQGYTLYAENEINENRFATYTNDDYSLNMIWTPALNRITVCVDRLSDTALPPRESENTASGNAGCEATVTQLGLWIGYSETDRWDAWINGLAHVIQLEDGSFLIIDGGHDRAINEELLYNTLKKQAPDPDNIVVAAWIFTHAHRDHTGAFLMFDHDEVTVERFIYNFPTASEGNNAGGGQMSSVAAKIDSFYPEAEVINAHPGQVYHIRNAKIEMLWTLDLYYPKSFTFFNESSLVFTLELEGHRILYLGDMGPASNPVISQIYGNALQTDLVQTAHHGFEGASYAFYALVKPKYVFWNTGYVVMDQYGNNYFSRNDDIVKWIAMDTVTVVKLREGEPPDAETFENSAAYLGQES